ncbi:MAG: hypothetical protein AABY15_08460, partial [Nanoarchaeota archaeon]
MEETISIKDIAEISAIKDEIFDSIENFKAHAITYNEQVEFVIEKIILGKGSSDVKAKAIYDLIKENINNKEEQLVSFNDDQEWAIIKNNTFITEHKNKINNHLKKQYGYSDVGLEWRKVKDKLHKQAMQQPIKIHPYALVEDNQCYIGTKHDGLLQISPESIQFLFQGANANKTYVTASCSLTKNILPIIEQQQNGWTFTDLLKLFPWEDHPEEQMFLFKCWFFYSLGFPASMRPLICVTGDKGSGKTMFLKCIKSMLFNIEDRNPDLIPMDEYEFNYLLKDRYYWFIDELNFANPIIRNYIRAIVTGMERQFRYKYDRNLVVFKPLTWLMFSAYTPKIREDDIVQRMLLLRFARPKKSINESIFFN